VENLKPLRQVALLHQVEQGQLGRLVLLGDRDDQAQVGLDEGFGRLVTVAHEPAQLSLAGRGDPLGRPHLGARLPTGFDGLGQTGLIVLGEQCMLTDVVQVESDQVFLGLSGVVVGHSSSSLVHPDRTFWQCGRSGSRTANGARQEIIVPDQG
jgi:hypothetical protein